MNEVWTPPAKTIDDTLSERPRTHGNYPEVAERTQRRKADLRSHPGWDRLSNSQRETLDMIAHKEARILCGDPNHADHWHDIAGYALLIEKDLK